MVAQYLFSKFMKGLPVCVKVKTHRRLALAAKRRKAEKMRRFRQCLSPVLYRVNQEPRSIYRELQCALQRLVEAIQGEHTANVTPTSASASRAPTGFATLLSSLACNHELRRFVVVCIANTLLSTWLDDPTCNLADVIRCTKPENFLAGWAAQDACIALVSALKTWDGAGFKRESITAA